MRSRRVTLNGLTAEDMKVVRLLRDCFAQAGTADEFVPATAKDHADARKIERRILKEMGE